MNNLYKLADFLDAGPNGEPPGIVWLFVGIWVFFMVGIPIILGIKAVKEKRKKAEQAAEEARRQMLSGEYETRARKEERIADERQNAREKLASSFARISPDLRQRLEDKKTIKEHKDKREQLKTKDNLRGQLKPHNHKDSEQIGPYGSLDYCDYDDYFFPASTSSIEDGEIGDNDISLELSQLTDGELSPSEAAELMILGDVLNNPSYKRK